MNRGSLVRLTHVLPEAPSGAEVRAVAAGRSNRCTGVTGWPHDNRGVEARGEKKEGSGIMSPSLHPLTHCGTISVLKMYRPATRHLSHSVHAALRSAQAAPLRQLG